MGRKLTHVSVPATFLTTIILLLVPVFWHEIPAVTAHFGGWTNINDVLAAAEKDVKVIKVRKDGSGDFKTVSEAVDSVPSGNTKRTILWIGPGEYREKICVDRTKPFVTFYGSRGRKPKLTYDGTAAEYGTVNSATVEVDSDYFMAVNIIFQNSAAEPDGKREGAQAVAMRISGDKAAFYNCDFIGFQDTLCDDKGNHFFKSCYIQGTVDFIFGNGKSLYLKSEIHSVAGEGFAAITAQAREKEDEDSGFAFVRCNITGTGNTYLGRAWKERAKVVFAYTNMDTVVNPQGWYDKGDKLRDRTVFYGEYKCTGAGANTTNRAAYTKLLTDEEARPYLDKSFVDGATWLLPPPKL